MQDLPFTTEGIVRCRDLVQLVRGARLNVVTKYSQVVPASPGWVQLVPPDPRRIRLELVLLESTGLGSVLVFIGPLNNKNTGIALEYPLSVLQSIPVLREWLTDCDGVTEGLACNQNQGGGGTANISVRETLLSPLPVDEPVT